MSAAREQQLQLNITERSKHLGVAAWAWLRPNASQCLYDRTLFTLAITLLVFGFVMVTSASLPTADKLTGQPFYFAIRHTIYVTAGLVVLFATLAVPTQLW